MTTRSIGLTPDRDTRIDVRLCPRVKAYVDDIIMDERIKHGYQPSISEVVESLIWKGIRA